MDEKAASKSRSFRTVLGVWPDGKRGIGRHSLSALDYGPAYNETLLLNLGLAVPTPGWTWETLEEIATKATRIRPDGVTESLGMNWPIYWTRLHPLVRAGGGDYLDRRVNPTRSTLLSEGVIRALSLIDRISERGGLDGSWGTQFHSGKAALSFNAGPNVGSES